MGNVFNVKVENVSNGLKRLSVVDLCGREAELPKRVSDDIITDFMRNDMHRRNCSRRVECGCNTNQVHSCRERQFGFREPDGIDVHVDRPLRENFRWHGEWVDAMNKYRKLENSAKECNWPCREPMRGHEIDFEDEMNEFDEFTEPVFQFHTFGIVF